MAGNEDGLILDGTVDAHSHKYFTVLYVMNDVEHSVLCTLSGKMRNNNIKVMPGDKVRFRLDEYNTKKGIITFRGK